MQKRKQEKIKEIEEKQQMRSKSVLKSGGKKKKGVNNDVGHFLSSYGKVTIDKFFFCPFAKLFEMTMNSTDWKKAIPWPNTPAISV